jgi:hypothetical protein
VPGIRTKAKGPLTANAAAAAQEIPSFVNIVRAAVAAAPKAALQEANTVTVQPGGMTPTADARRRARAVLVYCSSWLPLPQR